MKKHLLCIALLLAGVNLVTKAQQIYKENSFSVKMPTEEWYLSNKVEINSNLEAAFFKRVALKDEKGMKVIPNIAILTEELPATNIDVELYARHLKSTKRYKHIDLSLTDEVHPDGLENVRVYKGSYTDPRKNEHTVYILYAVNGRKGLHFVADIRNDVFKDAKDEFIEAIKSISTY